MEKTAKKSRKINPTILKIGYVIGLIIWTFLVFYLLRFILSFPFALLLKHTGISANFAQMLYSIAIYVSTIYILIYIPRIINKKWTTSRADLGIVGFPTFGDLGLAPAGFVISTILSGIVIMILSNFDWFNATETQNIGFNISYGFDRFVALFSLVIIAPIAEEVIFRGYLYGKLKKHLGLNKIASIIIATTLTSLVFATMHLTIDKTGLHQLNAAINVFIMSLVLCALREISGSIYAGILMHMIKNIIAFYILYSML